MAKFPTYEEMGEKVAEEALDGYIYKGKTLREWIDIIAQTRWIPVSERLPEEEGLYLVYTEEQPFVCSFEDGEFFIDEVLAWMPLPEPYKAESEDEI